MMILLDEVEQTLWTDTVYTMLRGHASYGDFVTKTANAIKSADEIVLAFRARNPNMFTIEIDVAETWGEQLNG